MLRDHVQSGLCLPTVLAKGELRTTLDSSAWAEAPIHHPRTWSVGQKGTCVVLSHQDLELLDIAIQYNSTTISHHYLPTPHKCL